jgi:hypothetical protein
MAKKERLTFSGLCKKASIPETPEALWAFIIDKQGQIGGFERKDERLCEVLGIANPDDIEGAVAHLISVKMDLQRREERLCVVLETDDEKVHRDSTFHVIRGLQDDSESLEMLRKAMRVLGLSTDPVTLGEKVRAGREKLAKSQGAEEALERQMDKVIDNATEPS